MQRIYKIIIVCLAIIAIIIFGLYSGIIDSGSYSDAEQYQFEVTDSVLIIAIKNFKDANPDFRVPKSVNLTDSTENYKYHFYLYDSREDNLIHCFILSADGSNKASIYLDAINSGLRLGNWKVVNEDYDRTANLEVKKEFREKVLDKLKLSYEDKGNNAFIFWK
jgi:hypothetical protein